MSGFVDFPDLLLAWLLKGFRALAKRLPGGLAAARSLRLGRALTLAVLAALLLTAGRVLPLVYGRFALAQEAATAAQQVTVLGEATVLARLQRKAFALGFTEAASADCFRLEYRREDGVELCAVSYDFIHSVDCYGVAKVPLRVQGQVVRAPMARIQTTPGTAVVE